MYRIVGGVLLLLLAAPPGWSEDKPDSPAKQYQALLQEYRGIQQAFTKALGSATTPEERNKIITEKRPRPEKLAPKFLALAEKYPKDPVAFDALSWILTNPSQAGPGDSTRAKAVALLRKDHLASKKLETVLSMLQGINTDPESLAFLRDVIAKSPNKGAQAEASAALGRALTYRVRFAGELKKNPGAAARYEGFLGKETVEELRKADLSKVEAEAEEALKDFAERFAGEMKPDRLANLCNTYRFSGGKAVEPLLRALMEKDARKEVQGVACLTLAQVLKTRADELASSNPKEAKNLEKECETLLERAVDKYADVNQPFGRGTIGTKAKAELYDIRFLAVGKPAPKVQGEDQDGQKFKLSDYQGKVVLLDFWSQF